MTAGPWSSWWNAEVYDRVVRETEVYTALNERLVAMAGLPDAGRVLDVGCGTGATTLACLSRMPRDSEIIGVDPGEPMVSLARQQVIDPRASFIVSAAEELEAAVAGPFDRVVANAAAGRFDDLRAAIGAIARIIAPRGGLFVFNFPADRFEDEPGLTHALQATLARLIESVTDVPFRSPVEQLEVQHLESILTDAGFGAIGSRRVELPMRREDMVRLLEVPAIFEPMAPHLSTADRSHVIEKIRDTGHRDEVFVVPWLFFSARKVAS